MRLRSSCYVKVVLLAVAAIHGNANAEDSEVVSLDEAVGAYAGPDGYAHVAHVPVGVGVLRFFKGSKNACRQACKKDTNCKGFKWSLHSDHLAPSSGACSLMGSTGSAVGKLVPRAPAPGSTSSLVKKPPSKPGRLAPSKRQVAKALKVLEKEAPTESKKTLQAIKAQANRNMKKPLVPAKRNMKRFAKRSLGMIQRIAVLEATLKQFKKFRMKKIAALKLRIKKKIRNLKAGSAPGSQMQVQRRLVREARHRLRRKIQRRDRSARRSARNRKSKRKLKHMLAKFGAKITRKVLRKQLTKLRNSVMKNKIRLSARDFGRPSLTSSKFADNLAKCPRLKRLCESSSKVRQQCPSTCKSLLVQKKRADAKKLATAAKMIAAKVKIKAKAAAKKLRAIKRHNNEVQGKTAAVKEAQNKLKAKAKKLQVKKDNRKIVYKVRYSGHFSDKKQKQADQKSFETQQKGIAMAIAAGKAVDKGSKLLNSAKKTLKTQKKMTKRSKRVVSVAVVKKGKVTMRKPHPIKDSAKATKLSGAIKRTVGKGMSQMNRGVTQLKKARNALKKAIVDAKGPRKPSTKSKAQTKVKHVTEGKNARGNKTKAVKQAEKSLQKATTSLKKAKQLKGSKTVKQSKAKQPKANKAKPKQHKPTKPKAPAKPLSAEMRAFVRREKPQSAVVELGEELGDDAMDASDMYAGIVCRIRTALKLGQTHHPKLLAKFEHSAIFLQKKAKLKPLWSCLHDGTKSDSQCGTLVSQSVGDLMDMLPQVQTLKKSIGPEYHEAVHKGCISA